MKRQLGLNHYLLESTPKLLMNNKDILIFLAGSVESDWSPEKHNYFSFSFRMSVLYLVLGLKRIHKTTKLKVPKFILFEIIKKMA